MISNSKELYFKSELIEEIEHQLNIRCTKEFLLTFKYKNEKCILEMRTVVFVNEMI